MNLDWKVDLLCLDIIRNHLPMFRVQQYENPLEFLVLLSMVLSLKFNLYQSES